MVIFLMGLVSMILMRTLRKDYASYSREEKLDDLVCVCLSVCVCVCLCLSVRVCVHNSILPPQERDLGDEYGWKQVHGDVFRPPSYPILFSGLIGTGHQLAVVALKCIIIALLGDLYML